MKRKVIIWASALGVCAVVLFLVIRCFFICIVSPKRGLNRLADFVNDLDQTLQAYRFSQIFNKLK